jgi:hypothetical protein
VFEIIIMESQLKGRILDSKSVDRTDHVRRTNNRVQREQTHDAFLIMQIRNRDVDEKRTTGQGSRPIVGRAALLHLHELTRLCFDVCR